MPPISYQNPTPLPLQPEDGSEDSATTSGGWIGGRRHDNRRMDQRTLPRHPEDGSEDADDNRRMDRRTLPLQPEDGSEGVATTTGGWIGGDATTTGGWIRGRCHDNRRMDRRREKEHAGFNPRAMLMGDFHMGGIKGSVAGATSDKATRFGVEPEQPERICGKLPQQGSAAGHGVPACTGLASIGSRAGETGESGISCEPRWKWKSEGERPFPWYLDTDL
ncbi:hypothetical protein CYMTET_38925 [Cymbomonas tetramitiformis]|uniref:Uncharacterized protein n=1 Tax=Cymbomonas tetramitiformis TaxID=36881 RepID=A0AAE0F641_9CHLO|nr:hypothetical protein CYMTET_38925 [Cymbomonas tetramitiformis]